MSDPERKIRILLVGDRAVGKTCMIKSLITSQVELNTNVPPRYPEIQVPFDQIEQGTTTVIVDTSLRTQSEAGIAAEVAKASVIGIVYAADTGEKSVKDFWLPFIRNHSAASEVPSKTPVVLIRNKTDIAESSEGETSDALLNECTPIMQEFREVVTCVGCSATNMNLVAEAFYYALNAVLFPMGPLYDLEKRCLVGAAVTSIERVFSICDRTCTDLLSDDELNKFQVLCFSGSDALAVRELESVKELIKESVQGGVVDGCVTLKGFVFLNQLFIERGRPETTWAVLRHFGYSDTLELTSPKHNKFKSMSDDQSIELSEEGIEFLSDRFDACAKGDSKLSSKQLAKFFEVVPVEWADKFTQISAGCDQGVERDVFFTMWRTLVLLDYTSALMVLAYLGFGIMKDIQTTNLNPLETRDVASAIIVTQRRLLDWKAKMTLRTSLVCYVIGSHKCKQLLFEQITTRSGGFETTALSTKCGSSRVVACAENKNLIVFADIDKENAETVQQSTTFVEECDTLLMVFDESDPESFAELVTMHSPGRFGASQTLVVGVKSESESASQNYATKPENFCWDRGLTAPLRNVEDEGVNRLVAAVDKIAKSPTSPWSESGSSRWVLASAAAAAILGIVIYRNYSSSR